MFAQVLPFESSEAAPQVGWRCVADTGIRADGRIERIDTFDLEFFIGLMDNISDYIGNRKQSELSTYAKVF